MAESRLCYEGDVDMYKLFLNAFRLLNLLFQALYSLGFPIGVGALISFLLTKYTSAPKWIWAILLTLGTFAGLFSMVKFILSATEAMKRLEKEQIRSDAERREKEEMQAALRKAGEMKGDDENE